MKPLRFDLHTEGATLNAMSAYVSPDAPMLVFANAVGMGIDLAERLAKQVNSHGLSFATWENRGSPGPARNDTDSALEVQANDLACLIDTFQTEDITVFGWCTGASIALHYAANHPGRLRGLAFYSPAFLMSGSPGRPIGDDMFSMCGQICLDPESAEVFYPIVRQKGGEERTLGLEDHLDLLHEVLRPYAGGVTALKRYAYAIRHTSAYDPRPLLQKIGCPVLLLGAEKDRLISTENCSGAGAQVKNCDIQILEEMGHYGLFTHRSVIDKVVEFTNLPSVSLQEPISVSSDAR